MSVRKLFVPDMICSKCRALVLEALSKYPEITVRVDLKDREIFIEHLQGSKPDLLEIIQTLEQQGYPAKLLP